MKTCEGGLAFGDCKEQITGWYYSAKTVCRRFILSGCGLSTNGFETEQECKAKCGNYIQFNYKMIDMNIINVFIDILLMLLPTQFHNLIAEQTTTTAQSQPQTDDSTSNGNLKRINNIREMMKIQIPLKNLLQLTGR